MNSGAIKKMNDKEKDKKFLLGWREDQGDRKPKPPKMQTPTPPKPKKTDKQND